MLDSFAEKLSTVFRRLSGQGRLSEKNIQDALRELRYVLLESDVNFDVVKSFINDVRQKALGEEVMKSLTPTEQFFKIVKDSLVELMGGSAEPLRAGGKKPDVFLLCGIQGAGKTTTCAKLALHLQKKGRRMLLAPLDVKRPAAVDQLRILADANGLPFFFPEGCETPVEIARRAQAEAVGTDVDILILDTAGRMHVDDEMMEEARAVSAAVSPVETLLVLDGMTGQDAVNIAKAFEAAVGVTGYILTKMDGDARGGAALSIRYVTGKHIKFIGTGEKVDMLEQFHADRFINRILGMGDLVSLIEKVEETIDMEEARKLERKLMRDEFNLEDFIQQIRQVRRMGAITNILGMIPGLGALAKNVPMDMAEKQMKRVEAMVLSMTMKERRNPDIINSSRKKRIAGGSGTTIQEINQLLKQFKWMQKMMKQLKHGRFPSVPVGKILG
ncbi:MAG: signal recognition particle protein [bacterium]